MDKRVEETAQAPLGHAEIRSILTGIMLAMFLAALDQTIVATAMPTIGRELGDVEHLPWVVTAYLLAATAVTPLYGTLADSHGRRVVLLSGSASFSLILVRIWMGVHPMARPASISCGSTFCSPCAV